MLSKNTTTISEFIKSAKSTSVDYGRLSFMNELTDGNRITRVSVLNVVSDYIYELREQATLVRFTKEQFRKYKYKPKLLCHDIYGNPELYYIILLMNDMADVKEFNKETLYMLKKDVMMECLANIYNNERTAIQNYNSRNIT